MPYQKAVRYTPEQRQFSALLTVPWKISIEHPEELRLTFGEKIMNLFGNDVRVTVKLHRTNSTCRFTAIFSNWQQDADAILEQVKVAAEESIKKLRNKYAEVLKNRYSIPGNPR